MYPRLEPLATGDPLQQTAQPVAFRGGQSRAHCLIMCLRNLTDLLQHRSALRGELERIDPAVLGAVPPRSQPGLLQRIHHHHEAAGVHSQCRRQLCWLSPALPAQDAQDSRVLRLQVQGGEPFGEACCGTGTDLIQQKRDESGRSDPQAAQPCAESTLYNS
jgi:hypothetical protein